ncbi:MAG: hypothetical protein WKF84_13480 [Pyrinomonadaceae bacterium]
MSQHTAPSSESPVRSLKIWWLITGRVIACIMLMMLSATWSPEWAARNFGRLPADFLLLISSVCLLSACYALLQRFSSHLEFQVRLQLCLDVLLISWLVWLTGDVRSPYVALYMIVISIAGLYLGARDAMTAAIGCAAFYTFITLPVVLGIVPSYGPSLFVAPATTAESIQKIGLNDIAFVVGLLAARLAQQRAKSDDQLIAATHASLIYARFMNASSNRCAPA